MLSGGKSIVVIFRQTVNWRLSPSKVVSVVRMGALLQLPVTAVPSRGITPTFNAAFCKLWATLGASGEDHTWRGEEAPTLGGGDKEELMALLSQRVKNERMRWFFHL